MRPRRLLTMQDTIEVVEQSVRDNALAVLTLQSGDEWSTFKSRFLESDPSRRFFVLDYQPVDGQTPPNVDSGQCVGLTVRYKSRKVMFATVVEAKGRFVIDSSASIPAVRYRWPATLMELQRRVYYRTPVPPATPLVVNAWPGGANARNAAQSATLTVVSGHALDISCGGALIRLNQLQAPPWDDRATLGIELHLPDGRPPALCNAHFRGVRHDAQNDLCVAIQFVGLEVTAESRAILQRISRTVQKFHRQTIEEDLRSGQARPPDLW